MNIGKTQKKIIAHLKANEGRAYIGIGKVIEPLRQHSIEDIENSTDRLIQRGFLIRTKPGFYELTEKGKSI